MLFLSDYSNCHSLSVFKCFSMMRVFCFLIVILFNINELLSDSVSEENERIPYKFAAEPTLPEMVVFNFDEVIWPFKVDEVMVPPLKSSRRVKYQITDYVGKVYDLFPEAGPILEELFKRWYKVGGLVHSTDFEKIEKIMTLYDIDKFFKFFELLPGSKLDRLKRIGERANVPLEDILYFDSNQDDLEALKAESVNTVYVDPKEGLTYKHIDQGFKLYLDAKNDTYAHYANLGQERIFTNHKEILIS